MFNFFKNTGSKDAVNKNAAANELESEKLSIEMESTVNLDALKEKAGPVHFVYDNRVFIVKLPRCNIPGIGKRTAIEICTDEKAQAWLIKENCIGSVIVEIL